MRPEDTLTQYQTRINLHDFDQLVPLISPDEIFWFNDGSHVGLDDIRKAFEATWRRFPLEDYWLEDMNWIAMGDAATACTYHFRWRATIEGKTLSGGGEARRSSARNAAHGRSSMIFAGVGRRYSGLLR